jgi:SAM-dependent methyltransferase
MNYEDHFSGHANAYSRHRPQYPEALFAWLDSVVPGHALAWDAGTGSGQVAVALAQRMTRVVATDASADQLANAMAHARVEYRHEPADRVSLEPATVDLVTAGAAAHWFELDGFYREVRRVAKRGAIVALFSYGPRGVGDAIDPIVHHFQETVLQGYWPERIRYVHDRYATLPFPFEELEVPDFRMAVEWTLSDLVAFLNTWSASQRYLQEKGKLPTAEIEQGLAAAWKDPQSRRVIEWPVFVRAGRV